LHQTQLKFNFLPVQNTGDPDKQLLLASGLEIRFQERVLFSGVSFEIRGRDKICVCGPNGCGKSTLLALLLGSLFVWHRTLGSVSASTVSSPKAEAFYWLTIMFSQTLGTALGDWMAGTAGLGYTGAAVVFSGLLALVVAAYYWTGVSRTLLFWAAFILTRPLGAVVGDFLDKPLSAGGLALSRYSASAALLAFMLVAILVTQVIDRVHRAFTPD